MATLRVGTLDLSAYLDVQAGNGMDPAAPSFSDRVFSHSLLREGGVLALEDLKLKELLFPLYLKAASKDALHQLVQAVNQALAVQPQTTTWQDDGASTATTFDIASGQLDIDYDFRRGQNNYLHARLRLFAQPLGRTSSARLVASAATTGPVLQFQTASPILGDAPPLQLVRFGGGNANPQATLWPRYCAFSVLPGPSYNPLFTASNFIPLGLSPTSGFIQGGSGAVASQFFRHLLASRAGADTFRTLAAPTIPVAAYTGRNRILAIMRPIMPPSAAATAPSLSVYMTDPYGNTVYPTVTLIATPAAFASAWNAYDMGVLGVPSGIHPTITSITITGPDDLPTPSLGIDITAIVVLPENSTTFITDGPDNSPLPVANDTYLLDDLGRTSWRQTGPHGSSVPDAGRFMDDSVRGALPRPIGGTLAYFAVMEFAGLGNDTISGSVSVYERTRYVF